MNSIAHQPIYFNCNRFNIKILNTTLFCFVLFLYVGIKKVHAQEDTFAIINSANDTTAILRLIDKGKEFSNKMPNLALQYFTRTLEMSKKMNYPKGVALASAQLGRWYFGNDAGKSVQLG